MSDIKLFQLKSTKVIELEGKSVTVEKSLQSLIERYLEAFLGVTFLATEYSTGTKHSGRIDTLGIDENNCPVIIEYKRATNENVINQGLYYLDWLLDHKAEFQLLVMKKKNKSISEQIEWDNARLICIAGDYTKYDTYAVEQINRNIEMIRYKKYQDLLLLELVNTVSAAKTVSTQDVSGTKYKSVSEHLAMASQNIQDIFELLKSYLLALGDDVQFKTLYYYFAFKRIKNFASIQIHPKSDYIMMFLKLDPKTLKLEIGFSRDVTKIGHQGTGDLELSIKSLDDLEKAKPFILKSYELS
jgi:predicted transport protein